MISRQDLLNEYLKSLKSDEVRKLSKLLNDHPSYKRLYAFVSATTHGLVRAFELIDPGETLTVDTANDLVRPLLDLHGQLVSDRAHRVQKVLNEENGVALEAVKAPVSKDRVDGIIKRACTGSFEDSSWVLDSGVMAFAKSLINDTCELNADQQYAAGLTPVITRTTGADGCCKWCQQWIGTWTYPDVPREVYQTHRACNCTIEYKNGRMKQNVRTRAWSDLKPSEIVRQPRGMLTSKQAEDYEKYLQWKGRQDRIRQIAEERGMEWDSAVIEERKERERLRSRTRRR